MKKIVSLSEMTAWSLRQAKQSHSIGFVPTMGALHEGHLSLVRTARKKNKRVVVSVFVNPTQFGPKEDFKKYPRTLAQDERLLKKEKADILFLPKVTEMYPKGFQTEVKAGKLGLRLCGQFRAGHFDGVCTVVAKLFNLVRPTKAYFGQKDYQQAVILKRMVKDLNMPLALEVLPTIREMDGLAMSSRNAYLSELQRAKAPMIYLALEYAEQLIRSGETNVAQLKKDIQKSLEPVVDKIQYVEILDLESLENIKQVTGDILLGIACTLGKTRLIDNRVIKK